jgi:phage gpG-like protein
MTQIPVAQLARELASMGERIKSDSLASPLRECDRIVKQGVRDNFTSSASPDNQNWRPRKKRKNDDGHPLLVDTGDLLQAATGGGPGHVSRVEDRSVAVGVNLDTVPYARAHNYGYASGNLPQREFLGMREERVDECEEAVGDYVMAEVIG